MKSKEELNALRDEIKALNAKLVELTSEELEQVTGGVMPVIPGVGLPFVAIGGIEIIQEREERLRTGWLDQGTLPAAAGENDPANGMIPPYPKL